jgi:hypothetical protein
VVHERRDTDVRRRALERAEVDRRDHPRGGVVADAVDGRQQLAQ